MDATRLVTKNGTALRRWLRRALIAVVVGVLLLVLYSSYIVWSFDTETLPPRYGQVDEQFFPPAETYVDPRPLLVLLGGAEGGNAWASNRWMHQRDSFRSKGYALLALGYFGLPHTPENLDRISLEGVHEAIIRAATHPRVNPDCIAVIGGSRGAELALLLGSTYPDIGAVVGIVPPSSVFVGQTDAMLTSAFSFNGEPVPFVPMSWSATTNLLIGDVGGAMRKLFRDQTAMEAAAIAVERINGPILLVSATEDEMWPSQEMAQLVMQRLDRHQFRSVYEHWPIAGGHAEPLNSFPQIESFLQSHFCQNNS